MGMSDGVSLKRKCVASSSILQKIRGSQNADVYLRNGNNELIDLCFERKLLLHVKYGYSLNNRYVIGKKEKRVCDYNYTTS